MAASKIALLSHGLLPYCFSLLSSCHSVLMSEKLSRPRWSWFRLVHVRTNCILTFQSSLKIGGSYSASPPFLVCLTIYHSVIRTLYSLRLVKPGAKQLFFCRVSRWSFCSIFANVSFPRDCPPNFASAIQFALNIRKNLRKAPSRLTSLGYFIYNIN